MQAPKSSTEITKPHKRKEPCSKEISWKCCPKKIPTDIAEPTDTHTQNLAGRKEGSKLEPY